jgi:DNA-binding NarL/FixJ family response regulator
MTPEQGLIVQGQAPMPQHPSAVPKPTTPPKKSPPYPAGLTAREVEILRLIAQGLILQSQLQGQGEAELDSTS